MGEPNEDPEAAAPGATTVRRCGPEDRSAQADLFNRCFKKRVSAEDLVWRYDANPHGGSASFLTTAPGEPGEPLEIGVSGYACSPRLVLAAGDAATAARVGETGDVMTDPRWRKRGLFSALDRACLEETRRLGWPCVFGLPNRRSAHIFLTLGWERIGTVRPWTFVLAADADARAVRRREGRLAAWMTGHGARRGRDARSELARRAGGLRIEPIRIFPREVDALAAEVAARYAFMVRRDASYLTWRFLLSPSGLHRALAVRDEMGDLAGYAVIQLPRAGEPRGYLVDVLARDDAALAAAIEAGLAALEEAGASVVQATAIDGSWWRAELERAGFLPPKQENHLIVILYTHDKEHPVARAARDASAWYFTDGDRDDETMG